jgi:hypothetical protein
MDGLIHAANTRSANSSLVILNLSHIFFTRWVINMHSCLKHFTNKIKRHNNNWVNSRVEEILLTGFPWLSSTLPFHSLGRPSRTLARVRHVCSHYTAPLPQTSCSIARACAVLPSHLRSLSPALPLILHNAIIADVETNRSATGQPCHYPPLSPSLHSPSIFFCELQLFRTMLHRCIDRRCYCKCHVCSSLG